MKKIITLSLALAGALSVHAQHYYIDATNSDMLRHATRQSRQRTEFVIPQVNGYTVYKADLHTHSIFSDGNVTPEFRVQEAWHDGLDVLAITEHAEYRPYEQKMVNYLDNLLPEGTKAFNTNVIGKDPDKNGIKSDLNYPVRLAENAALSYGLTIIPGIEVTRTPETFGHYNALFTTDNNVIYDADPVKAFKNARAQGALVMHNHPGWRRTSLEQTEFETRVYAEKLIDGIEIMNGSEFYPRAITRAQKEGFFVSANTDIHGSTAEDYRLPGNAARNMTLILAKDKSLASLKEALLAHRSLAYSFGSLAGDKQLLADLFKASIKVEVLYTNVKNGSRTVSLTNNSSIAYTIRRGKANPVTLNPFSTIMAGVAKDAKLEFTVENMWCGENEHPLVELTF